MSLRLIDHTRPRPRAIAPLIYRHPVVREVSRPEKATNVFNFGLTSGGWGMARLVVVSNRVSIPGDGIKRAGGLEVVLRPALQHKGGVWFGWSGKVAPADELEARSVRHKNVEYAVTDLSKEDFEEYYSGFANRVLWPILHYRLDLAGFAPRDLSGYFRVNDRFATKLEKIIENDDLIWVHDYHLIPIADALRRRGHCNRIGFFLHVPFPPPEVLTWLPNHEHLIPLLMQYDVVGFQTEGDAQNFIRYMISQCNHTRDMPAFQATGRQVTLSVKGQQTLVGNFPVGIEPRAFARLARRNVRSPLVKNLVASLGGRDLVIGVDRLDYSKGLLQRLDAFVGVCGRPHQWKARRGVVDADPLREPRIQPVGARGTLSDSARRPGDPIARRNESRCERICRCSGSTRSGRPHPVRLRRRCG
jgi:trehalose 6-phosphate synthase